ncbi:methyltransferase domain-containing protein [Candidatus Saccharibacteria bacterium]|nr:methyltransferase domain-containing protein [Candidatus Saccharibacteria bacterium]
MQYLAILGRQPEISLAELLAQFENVRKISDVVATFESEKAPDLSRFGGSLKFGQKLDVSAVEFLANFPEGKITLGVSDYSKKASSRSAQAEALRLKRILKRQGRSVRVLPNTNGPAISTAAAHHEGLGTKSRRAEIMLVGRDQYFSLGAQNITAYARRDRARPARDAKVGMLPPKLAQILINLCGPLKPAARILDPFCGTGVVLQEALLMGYRAYGTDLSDRMIEYSRRNLRWLEESNFYLAIGDATDFIWQQPIDAVVFEGYLGPPMSNPPAEIKLKEVKQELKSLYHNVFKNLSSQLESGTPVVMAIPAWLRPDGSYSRLNLLDEIEKLGYNVKKDSGSGLLYARAGQVVAREILILRKK